MRVIVCGGRFFADQEMLYSLLDATHQASPISLLIEGGARGADALANQWARERKVKFHTEHAQWNKYKRSAGPIRNNEMLMMKPDLVIAFPGDRGTADMIKQARNLGVEVIDISQVIDYTN